MQVLLAEWSAHCICMVGRKCQSLSIFISHSSSSPGSPESRSGAISMHLYARSLAPAAPISFIHHSLIHSFIHSLTFKHNSILRQLVNFSHVLSSPHNHHHHHLHPLGKTPVPLNQSTSPPTLPTPTESSSPLPTTDRPLPSPERAHRR